MAKFVLHRVIALALALGAAVLGTIALVGPASAISTADFLASLSDDEITRFREWKHARRAYDEQLDTYWGDVDDKRAGRKKKRAKKIPFDATDYVMAFPPKYDGPALGAALAKKYDAFLEAQKSTDVSPPKELSRVSDYLEAAKTVYNFVPERVSEKEFKRRYAQEAHSLGLTKEQVVRIYALETGGIGTYDMQAGIHPIKKTGRAISSALGYAQLLDANSVNEVSRSGETFIRQLNNKLRDPNNSTERVASLKRKIAVLKKMYANCKRVPFEWDRHQAYAKTAEGMGVHMLNIDADIGPMLQAMKLRTLKDTAAERGKPRLSGAEMELMNLAGPLTGMEMMQPPGSLAPTANFFSRRAYYVNKMVIGLTGEGLQAELDRRMSQAITTAGSQEFAAAFDVVSEQREAGR